MKEKKREKNKPIKANLQEQCAALSSILLEGDVLYPNSTLYATENTYWSNQQSEARPACFVTPRSAADVSAVVRALVGLGAAFSVKAGGHTAFRGGSNANGGVTLDLLRMDGVVVSDDRQTVAVGPGARWIRVAEVLDPLGLAVVGGRVADVGVSGLLLGGGISYFSGEHGWACDNVRSYEVVLVCCFLMAPFLCMGSCLVLGARFFFFVSDCYGNNPFQILAVDTTLPRMCFWRLPPHPRSDTGEQQNSPREPW